MKRIFSMILAAALLFCIVTNVSASAMTSNYFSLYSALLKQGNCNGQLAVEYNTFGVSTMDKIGVSKIVVFSSDGTKIRTINGTVINSLLATNSSEKSGSYYFSVVAGQSYYCQVTVYAEKNGEFETQTITTGLKTAPIIP